MNAIAQPQGAISAAEWRKHRDEAMLAGVPGLSEPNGLPGVLLAYQVRLLASTAKHSVTICEKSRRIGATWGIAADAVLTAGAQKAAGGMDTMYIGYNMDMAREFVDACGMWARAIMPAATQAEEFLFEDQDEHGKVDRHIQAYRIRFASGFEIVALSSKPRSLRGRQGYLIFDEAAFHDDLNGMMKAALAFLIWGGKILIISTHDGEENPFNELIKEARAGKKPYNVVRITFDDALRDGLFKRICLVGGKEWSQAAEDAWAKDIRAFYGDHSEEELDAVPAAGTGVYLTTSQIEACMRPDIPVVRLTCAKGFDEQSDEARKAFIDAWCEDHLKPLLDQLDPAHRHCFGEDFGRTSDLTVIVPLGVLPNLTKRAPFFVELRNTPFVNQEQILKFVVDRLPRFFYGALDKGGNGAFLAERAAQKYGALRIAQISLSEEWYREQMPKMKTLIEERTLLLPKDDLIGDDFRLIKLIKGVARIPDKRSGSKDEKRHGDAAVACALAVYASNQSGSPIEFEVLEGRRTAGTIDDFQGGGFGADSSHGFMGYM